MSMLERVQKIIANSGYCSRRKAEEFIVEGRVSVNGKRIKLGDKADVGTDEIMVGKTPILQERKMYIMLHKPEGYITTVSDSFDRKKVTDLVPFRVYPVGRLDRDARGLLLLTNDGEFANKIMHPRYETSKTYFAILDKPFQKEDGLAIERGVKLKDGLVTGKTRRIQPKIVEITIHEGRNKIVKRLFHELGYYVKRLERVAIGRLRLDIKEGRWRFLKESELDKIFMR